MNNVKTIDLWTEQIENHLECISGAFIDGFENGNIPFDSYKIVRNCNCIITSNQDNLNISNKHNAIVFYKENVPVRLMVINKGTNLDECLDTALNQPFENTTLASVYSSLNIQSYDVDLNEQPIHNKSNSKEEIDVGSCDRPSLLECMLEGSYTQSDTDYGKSNTDSSYQFLPNIHIIYSLTTDIEKFEIEHHCAFINNNMTRIIPLQDNSSLDIAMLHQQYCGDEEHVIKK